MSIKALNPYLNFNGTAAEAIKLYERALGAKTENVMRFGDIPGSTPTPETKDRIMHARLQIGAGIVMISDTPLEMPSTAGGNMHVALHFDDAKDAAARFDALAAGGTVTMPLQDTFWGATFGMLTDAYGIHWMFNTEK
jgi:PhnB protein